MRWMLLLLALPMAGQAAVYKCLGEGGRVMFSDRPCAGAVDSDEHRIEVTPPPAPSTARQSAADAKRAADWEEARRFYYVEIPQLERQAVELMASPDPARQALGREMAWKAQQGREAFKELERAHKRSEETKRRYGDALRQFGGY
jgi:hypothetical protein